MGGRGARSGFCTEEEGNGNEGGGEGLAVGFSSNVLRVDNYVLFTKLCCLERE